MKIGNVLKVLLLGMLFYITLKPVNVMAVTQEEGVKWAKDRIGQSIDTDGYYGAQCKDFVNAFTQENFGVTFPGNANNLIYCSLPSGWIRIKNTPDFIPQPGDIALWDSSTTSSVGHTSIIIEANINTFVSIDQNWYNANGTVGSPAAIVEHNYTYMNFWGVLRPPYTSGNNPQGCLDGVDAGTGCITVRGWAFDRDNLNEQLKINVYIDGELVQSIYADQERSDVNSPGNYPGVGDYHGFNSKIYTNKSGSRKVSVYAINVGGGDHTWLGDKTVNIGKDSAEPVIKDVKITNLSSKGYTVTCTVTDNVAVDRVQFPTWTEKNGQDDLQSDWTVNRAASGTINGNTVTYRVNASDHNDETGNYVTHIYAYDKSGNVSSYGKVIVVPDGIVPVSVDVYNGHIYAYFSDCYTWKEAKNLCETMGGHLATITSKEENDFINKLTSNNYAFIGCTDEEKEGTWKWITGEKFSYTNWSSGQPDNYNQLEHFGEIKLNGTWNDFPDTSDYTRGFVLEIDGELKASNEVSSDKYIYKSYDVSMPWEVAKVYCETFGGRLATITSKEENDLVTKLVANGAKRYYLLGISDKETENKWVDLTGKEISYTNWASGEPNNTNNEDYGSIRTDGLWIDVRSYYHYNGFVYQKNVAKKLSGTLKVNGSTSDKTVSVGSTVKLTVAGSGGSGSYTYTYKIYNNGKWTTLGTGATYSHKVSKAGSYRYVVVVKDSAGNTVDTNKITVTVAAALSGTLKVNGSTSDKTASVGDTIKLTATGSGGSGSYTYTHKVYNNGTWTTLGTGATYSHKVSKSGNYKYVVVVKDSTGNTVDTNKIVVTVK